MKSQNSMSDQTKSREVALATVAQSATRTLFFDELPDSTLVRITQLVRGPKNQGQPVPLPISAASLWRKVADGSFPAPTKLGTRIACWKVGEVREWLDSQVKSAKEGK